MSLAACPSCNRLVRAAETDCPFCAAPQPTARTPRRPIVGRISRSALLVTAAVTLGGPVETCRKMLGFDGAAEAAYGAVPPPPTVAVPAYGLAPPPVLPDAGVASPVDAGASRDAAVEAGVHLTLPTPVYGGPPRTR